MNSPAFTHYGCVHGCDSRRTPDYSRSIRLRQTRTLWIGEDCTRWRKLDGYRAPLEMRPLDRLDLDSVKPLQEVLGLDSVKHRPGDENPYQKDGEVAAVFMSRQSARVTDLI